MIASYALEWLLAPILLVALAVGWGWLVDTAVPGAARATGPLPLGLAAIVVVGTAWSIYLGRATAIVPVVAAVGVIGLVVGLVLPSGRRRVPGVGEAITGIVAYLVFALPSLANGTSTWAGWLRLDDGSHWVAMAERMVTAGWNGDGFTGTTHDLLLRSYFVTDYPVGAFMLLPVAPNLLGIDTVWFMQPLMAVMAGTLAIMIHRVLAPVIRVGALRAVIAVVSAQATMLYAYAMWGGVKELVIAVVLFGTAVTLAAAADATRRLPASLVAAAVLFGALWFSTGRSGAGYLGLIVVFGAIGVARGRGWISGRVAVAALALVAAGVVGVVVLARQGALSGYYNGMADIGNLVRPLELRQAFGIWLGGDFRVDAQYPRATDLLILVAVAALPIGIIALWRHRVWAPLTAAATALVVVVVADTLGEVWLTGKALAVASPFLLVLAVVGTGVLAQADLKLLPARAERLVGVAAAVLLCAGVLGSNALAYQALWMAPRGPISELEEIGHRFAGQGPGLVIETAPYATKYLLRDLAVEGATEIRSNRIPLRNAALIQEGQAVDIDSVELEVIQQYRLLILRRDPAMSRPPYPFVIAYQGDYYQVWRRQDGRGKAVAGLPLGAEWLDGDPSATADCAAIRDIAKKVPTGGFLAAASRPPVITVPLNSRAAMATWPNGPVPGSILPVGEGVADYTFDVPTAGTYGLWIAGAFGGELEVSVDGRLVSADRMVIEGSRGLTYPLGEIELAAGSHVLVIQYRTPWWRPGSASPPWGTGPVFLSTGDASAADVATVQPSAYRSLCGRPLDWVEAIQP